MANDRGRRIGRVINLLFWLAIWSISIYWTETFDNWLAIAGQAVVPLMLGFFIHYALRPAEGEHDHS